MAFCNPGRKPSTEAKANTLILDFPASKTEKFCCLSHPVYGVLLWQPEQSEIKYTGEGAGRGEGRKKNRASGICGTTIKDLTVMSSGSWKERRSEGQKMYSKK